MLVNNRTELDLSGIWEYTQDSEHKGKDDRLDIAETAGAGWDKVPVPSVFVHCNTPIGDGTGSMWYRRTFTVLDEAAGKRAVIIFDAVNFHSKIWINNHYAGSNNIGFLPFEIDVTDYLNTDSENEIIVWVNNEIDKNEIPPFFGWRNQGGIIRDVRLIICEKTYISNMYIQAEPITADNEKNSADTYDGMLKLSMRTNNLNETSESFNLQINIYDDKLDRKISWDAGDITLASGESKDICLDKVIENIKAWSPEQPALYYNEAVLIKDGFIIDNLISRFGFRKLEINDRKICLNGNPLFLLGFNRHDDTYKTGMALDKKEVRKDLEGIKSFGSNFMRMCHYPHSSYELDLCDELGLVVLAEIPLTFGNGIENLPEQLKLAREYLRRMTERDMNHPSIFFWSISNETGEGFDETNEVNDTLVQYAKELDSTRFAVHVSQCAFWGGEKAPRIFKYDDVICINGYPSLDARYRTKGDYDLSESCEYWVSNFKNLRNLYPDKPILVTEFGYATGSEVDGDKDEDMQSMAIETEFSVLTDEWISGCAIWCYADHLWPMIMQNNISPYGLLRLDRTPKKAYERVKSLYRERSGQ